FSALRKLPGGSASADSSRCEVAEHSRWLPIASARSRRGHSRAEGTCRGETLPPQNSVPRYIQVNITVHSRLFLSLSLWRARPNSATPAGRSTERACLDFETDLL